ncbi:hypothetical protein GCM10027612_24260 [Microbispora bryophytorum subsp. camponoti]
MIQGRVRWKRFALVFVPALAVASVLVGATAEGAIGASFVVSGDTFKVSADTLQGQGFVQYGSTVENKKGQKIPVAVSGIRKATLTNMCQTVLVKSPVGAVTIRITAGTGKDPVIAENMIVDATQIEGNAVFTKLEAGRDASSSTRCPAPRARRACSASRPPGSPSRTSGRSPGRSTPPRSSCRG